MVNWEWLVVNASYWRVRWCSRPFPNCGPNLAKLWMGGPSPVGNSISDWQGNTYVFTVVAGLESDGANLATHHGCW